MIDDKQDECRRAFESRRIPNLNLKRDRDGSYHYRVTNMSFCDFADGWKAALNTRQPETGKPGEVDIDDDPTGDAYAKGYADGYKAKAIAVEQELLKTRQADCQCPLPYRVMIPEQHIDSCPVVTSTIYTQPNTKAELTIQQPVDWITSFETDYIARYGHKPPRALNKKDPKTGKWIEAENRYCNTAHWKFEGWKAAHCYLLFPPNTKEPASEGAGEISFKNLPKGWCTLGVGDGSGKLFVHGDYDSIKARYYLANRTNLDYP